MNFPQGIIGPRVDQGDWVNFVFDDSDLTIRLPKVPHNKNNLDDISSLKDFRAVDTKHWDTNDQEMPCTQLALQRWNYEHERTLDDVARAELYVGLVETDQIQQRNNALLCKETFEATMLAWHNKSIGVLHDEKYEQNKNWPALANRYNGISIHKEGCDWFVIQLCMSSESKPVNLGMTPINNRFVLMTFIELQSLHYAGRTNPYSDETLKQFERDLFADFLNHIRIDYSPDLIAKIQTLKTKTPA